MTIQKSLHSQVYRSSLRQTAKLCLCREQENPSLWKCVPPHRDGQTGESNYKNGCLKTPFLHAPGQGSQLKSGYAGKEKGNSGLFPTQKKFRTFFLLSGEKVLVPLCHTLDLTKVTAASQSRHRRSPQPLPKHPPPTCEPGGNAGEGSRS